MNRAEMETVVIDEELIKFAYESERTYEKGEEAIEASREPMNMQEILLEARTLRLSFKNIFKIDNLHGFERLTTLCLDNNTIQEITNIAHLVNLQWLDLSFNNIKKIEGLETLTQLTDLSLCNNQIETLEGLDACTELQCLSIGNNRIRSTDMLMYLRKFEHLRLVNLDGNPVCSDPEYRLFVLAHLKFVKYLDYVLVQDSEVQAAREQYQDELVEIEEKEGIEEVALVREQTRQKQSAELEAANLGVVETLYDAMFKEDTEMAKLKLLPGIDELLETYRDNFKTTSEAFKNSGLERLAEREAERKAFEEALDGMRAGGEQRAIEVIERFGKHKKRVFRDLAAREHVDYGDLHDFTAAVRDLGNTLMDLEVQQVEQFEDLMNEFENHFNDMKNASVDAQQSYFRQVEELEDAYFDALTQLASDLLDKCANDLLPDDISPESRNLLNERDTCMNAVAGSHDIHVGKLLAREEEVRTREIAVFTGAVDESRAAEHLRNRNRCMEIYQLMERLNAEAQELVTEEVGDEDNED